MVLIEVYRAEDLTLKLVYLFAQYIQDRSQQHHHCTYYQNHHCYIPLKVVDALALRRN